MGGRGTGTTAARQREVAPTVGSSAMTQAEAHGQVITIVVVDKQKNEFGGGWRTIGDVPVSYTRKTGIEGLYVARDDRGYSVRDIVTDQVLSRGRTIKDSLRTLAKKTGLPVTLRDETAGNRVLGTWGY